MRKLRISSMDCSPSAPAVIYYYINEFISHKPDFRFKSNFAGAVQLTLLLEVHPCHFTFPLSFVPCLCHFCHLLMLLLDLSSLMSLFELSFSYLQDVLIWCARFLTYLTDYHYHYYPYRVAFYLEHSPPFHSALPAYHHHILRYQCVIYILVPSPFPR